MSVGAVYDRALFLESTKYGAVTDRAYSGIVNLIASGCVCRLVEVSRK
jgi:hypothetical protein